MESKAEREALLQSAAKFWPQWTERKHSNRSLWVAERVNAQPKRMKISHKWKPVKRHITQKWVSRNRVAIEKRSNHETSEETTARNFHPR